MAGNLWIQYKDRDARERIAIAMEKALKDQTLLPFEDVANSVFIFQGPDFEFSQGSKAKPPPEMRSSPLNPLGISGREDLVPESTQLTVLPGPSA